ncbi:unnamed protein product [Phytophthora fragariaefolia]|uniref:Unnamed protein product n=1 Tax=Phytophthora fragariaefolia TaxID=1490495 RepID=A0A9W6XYH0_9STRA|nr:unnamed protein product [Phytophthora fragariaefolia]
MEVAGSEGQAPATPIVTRESVAITEAKRLAADNLSEDDDSTSSEDGGTPMTSLTTPLLPCIIDGDDNWMDAGAETCTYLNSDEGPDEAEKREDESSNESGDDSG